LNELFGTVAPLVKTDAPAAKKSAAKMPVAMSRRRDRLHIHFSLRYWDGDSAAGGFVGATVLVGAMVGELGFVIVGIAVIVDAVVVIGTADRVRVDGGIDAKVGVGDGVIVGIVDDTGVDAGVSRTARVAAAIIVGVAVSFCLVPASLRGETICTSSTLPWLAMVVVGFSRLVHVFPTLCTM
jgi:hypothetical protein